MKLGLSYEHCDSCVVCLSYHIIAVISINAIGYMYAFCKHEANLKLITSAISLVKISPIMLEWSRRVTTRYVQQARYVRN